MVAPTRPSVRLAELVAVLSLGTDLGLGQPMEHVLRQCLISLRLAERLGQDEDERAVVYYSALLAWVGCHVDAHEQAKWFGDDLVMKGDARLVDLDGGRADVAYLVGHLGAGRPPLERLRLGLAFLGEGRQAVESMFQNHWLATEGLATALGMSQEVLTSLEQSFERWDGKGMYRMSGEDIAPAARLVALADVMVVFHRAGGIEAAVEAARERSGTQFDPHLVEVFTAEAADILGELDSAPTWETVIDAEPSLKRPLFDDDLERALEAIADFVDLKSPFTLGHSRTVADLAAAAARCANLPEEDTRLVRRAGLIHDLGRLGVPNTVWDKRGELTRADWERIRLHPYLTERMLTSSAALAPLAAIAAHHHERLDGSGYPRGLTAGALAPGARILAAADVYSAVTQRRPHRPRRSPAEAAGMLRGEVRAGRLDGEGG